MTVCEDVGIERLRWLLVHCPLDDAPAGLPANFFLAVVSCEASPVPLVWLWYSLYYLASFGGTPVVAICCIFVTCRVAIAEDNLAESVGIADLSYCRAEQGENPLILSIECVVGLSVRMLLFVRICL